jgi:thioredoxin reductase (NADPH)
MVTAEDIAWIEVLSELDPDLREQLARAAADLTLLAGEYAVHQGGEQALFGLLSGRIEAVRHAEGVEQVVGERQPGAIFGEVPITLGADFPVGFRAAEESRVLRIDARSYHTVASRQRPAARPRSRRSRFATGGPARLGRVVPTLSSS